jgi:hypothetical protein
MGSSWLARRRRDSGAVADKRDAGCGLTRDLPAGRAVVNAALLQATCGAFAMIVSRRVANRFRPLCVAIVGHPKQATLSCQVKAIHCADSPQSESGLGGQSSLPPVSCLPNWRIQQ